MVRCMSTDKKWTSTAIVIDWFCELITRLALGIKFFVELTSTATVRGLVLWKNN